MPSRSAVLRAIRAAAARPQTEPRPAPPPVDLAPGEPKVVVDAEWMAEATPVPTVLPSAPVLARSGSAPIAPTTSAPPPPAPAPVAVAESGFPRSAAERAGAGSSSSTARGTRTEPIPVMPGPASAPAAASAPPVAAKSSFRITAPLRRLEPVDRLAQGSVSAPLPTAEHPLSPGMGAANRPTPQRASELLLIPRPSVTHEPAHSTKELPSIFAVIDSRRSPEPLRARLDGSDASPPRRIAVAPAASGASATASRQGPATPSRGSSTSLDSTPSAEPTRAPEPAPARPRSRRSASFSEADAAFFAAGEELERGGEPLLDDEPVEVKRPTLWRRLTGRR